MTRMSAGTLSQLRVAVTDPQVIGRYRAHIKKGHPGQCWLWTGAISGHGHGRFHIASNYLLRPGGIRARVTYVVIAHRHRFGYALLYGVDALLTVPVLAHCCDNPLCQNPGCWRESDPYANARDYANRRHTVRGALTDTRGARGRARASETPLATAPTCRKRCSPGGGPCTATNSSCSLRRPGPNG